MLSVRCSQNTEQGNVCFWCSWSLLMVLTGTSTIKASWRSRMTSHLISKTIFEHLLNEVEKLVIRLWHIFTLSHLQPYLLFSEFANRFFLLCWNDGNRMQEWNVKRIYNYIFKTQHMVRKRFGWQWPKTTGMSFQKEITHMVHSTNPLAFAALFLGSHWPTYVFYLLHVCNARNREHFSCLHFVFTFK